MECSCLHFHEIITSSKAKIRKISSDNKNNNTFIVIVNTEYLF